MSRFDVLHIIKRRVEAAGPLFHLLDHRNYDLSAERRHARTRHRQSESPRTTKLYHRTREELSFVEVERIDI
jgi:hypothetical protein